SDHVGNCHGDKEHDDTEDNYPSAVGVHVFFSLLCASGRSVSDLDYFNRGQLAWPTLFRHPLEQRNNIRLNHGCSSDQSARGSRHHRRDSGSKRDTTDTNWKYLQGHGSKDIIPVLDIRQEDSGSHTEDCSSDTEEDAIDTRRGTTQASDPWGSCSKYSLPNILPDEQAERIDNEIGDDGLQSHAADIEEFSVQTSLQHRPAARLSQRDRKHGRKNPDGHDDKLRHISQGNGPHASDRGVN